MSEPTPTLGQTYSLTVKSQNSMVTHIAIFQKMPTLVGASTDFLSMAWMVGTVAPGSVDNAAEATFEWTIDYSVVTGYVQDQSIPGHPRRFSTQSHKNVEVDSQNLLQVVASPDAADAPGVPYLPSDPTDAPIKGVIQVQSDGSIPTDAQQKSSKRLLTVGLAMDTRVAVAVELTPNMLHQFTPHPTYFIVTGSFFQGQVVDTSTTSAPFQVMFGGVTTKTIVFTEKNVFANA